nr:hypothetical protein [Myroides sp. ZB35]
MKNIETYSLMLVIEILNFTGGLINTVRIKNFDLTVSAAFNLKQTVQATPSYNMAKVDPGRNYTTDLLNTWTPNNPNATLPGIIGNDY